MNVLSHFCMLIAVLYRLNLNSNQTYSYRFAEDEKHGDNCYVYALSIYFR